MLNICYSKRILLFSEALTKRFALTFMSSATTQYTLYMYVKNAYFVFVRLRSVHVFFFASCVCSSH